MSHSYSWGRGLFQLLNYAGLALLSVLCLLPIIHVLAVSFSSQLEVTAGEVYFWPSGWNLKSYQYVIDKPEFFRSMKVTLQRVLLGTALNMTLTALCAYPLSKEVKSFRFRTFFAWYFVFTILFNGGLIPWYLTIKEVGLLDSIWALVLPGAVPAFNVILLLNFFRGLPRELEESAFLDGAGHWTILWKIFVPLSLPAIATVTLLTVVGHWNSWFDGLILMNHPTHYPLSSYLQTVIIMPDLSKLSREDLELLRVISADTTRAAQIFVGMLPILLVYPFLQRFFIKGIVLGSVKE